jgi:hypothetical protein
VVSAAHGLSGGAGGIFRFNDGRNMPDVHLVLFDYHGVPVYVRLDLCSQRPETARFYGSKGILEASGGELRHIAQSGMDTAPSYYSGGFPSKMREYTCASGTPNTSFRPIRRLCETAVFQADNRDDLRPHMWNFFQAVQTRGTVAEEAVFGNHAAIACHMANESYFRKAPVYWDSASHDVRA